MTGDVRSGDVERIRDDLTVQAEALAEAAVDLLGRAVHADEPERVALANLERRVTRARRSVEKAIELLGSDD